MFHRNRWWAAVAVVCTFGAASVHAETNPLEEAQAYQADGRYGKALEAYLAAAQEGNPEAQRVAGLMLVHGERVYGSEIRQNQELGWKLLNQAAARGCEVSKAMVLQHNRRS